MQAQICGISLLAKHKKQNWARLRKARVRRPVVASSTTSNVSLTYLEGNSWIWTVDGLNILVDPWLEGNLDFGIPMLYVAKKKKLRMKVEDLPTIDVILITQGFDDHAHPPTLRELVKKLPKVPVVAPPSAKPILEAMPQQFSNVTYISHYDKINLPPSSKEMIQLMATPGARLGPPWVTKENGYVITSQDGFSMYYEPHCMFDGSELGDMNVDVVITPVIAQELGGIRGTLVDGVEKAVLLAKALKAKKVVAMANGDLDTSGPLNGLVTQRGDVATFEKLLQEESAGTICVVPEVGVATKL